MRKPFGFEHTLNKVISICAAAAALWAVTSLGGWEMGTVSISTNSTGSQGGPEAWGSWHNQAVSDVALDASLGGVTLSGNVYTEAGIFATIDGVTLFTSTALASGQVSAQYYWDGPGWGYPNPESFTVHVTVGFIGGSYNDGAAVAWGSDGHGGYTESSQASSVADAAGTAMVSEPEADKGGDLDVEGWADLGGACAAGSALDTYDVMNGTQTIYQYWDYAAGNYQGSASFSVSLDEDFTTDSQAPPQVTLSLGISAGSVTSVGNVGPDHTGGAASDAHAGVSGECSITFN